VNSKEIRDLIKLMEWSGVAELEVEGARFRLHIKLSHCLPVQPVSRTGAIIVPQQKEGPRPDGQTEKSRITVRSPLVGVFYRSPGPDADPFVVVGQPVKKGQTLCIVEAMKLFNEVESEVDGIVAEILVSDKNSIEQGEPLMIIEPS
jgi:acetyl-CoA carboxylase biotin carboxyl carrier protein